jgi:hypothetical protein
LSGKTKLGLGYERGVNPRTHATCGDIPHREGKVSHMSGVCRGRLKEELLSTPGFTTQQTNMTITWDNKSFTLFFENDIYWMTLPYTDHLRKGSYAPLGINITYEQAVERFFGMSYAFVYRTVGRIYN